MRRHLQNGTHEREVIDKQAVAWHLTTPAGQEAEGAKEKERSHPALGLAAVTMLCPLSG